MNLIEIMTVLAIVGVLGSIIAVGVMDTYRDAQAQTACIQMKGLEQQLQILSLRGRVPTTAEGLASIAARLPGGEVPLDPWDHPYVYLSPAGAAPFQLRSLGPDGVESGDDPTCGR